MDVTTGPVIKYRFQFVYYRTPNLGFSTECTFLFIVHMKIGNKFFEFNIQGSVYRKYIPIYIQQDAKLQSLFISVNCSTCFGWYLHPSSGAHTTVSTASGTCQTVTATCRYRGEVGTTAWQVPNTVDTVACARDDGWRYHPKHVEQFPEINKLCNFASCWIYKVFNLKVDR